MKTFQITNILYLSNKPKRIEKKEYIVNQIKFPKIKITKRSLKYGTCQLTLSNILIFEGTPEVKLNV